ncbi:MAG TPA: MFS transporter [Candidatus Dormibacteraeota bacterium]|jgi:MFS family permease
MITPFQSLHPRSANRRILLALTGAGLFLASLDAYVVVTAILPMLTSVRVPVNHLERATPIITGFLLGYLAAMPLAGGLSDRFGRLRLFIGCLLLFAAGSLLTATAGSLSQLVTGRLLQGAGGGALVPIVLALAADLYPAGGRGPVLGAVSALQEVGSVLGPIWGGLIAASLGWTWIFWINLPLAALLIWAIWPEATLEKGARAVAHIDWLGGLLAAAALALLTLALYASDPEKSPLGANFLWQAPLALLLFVLFTLHERRAQHPMLDVRQFRDSSFSGAAITNAVAGAGLMVALVYIPVIAESPIVFSMNPRQAALLLFRLMLGIPIGALLGGVIAGRLRSYRLVAAMGMLMAALGFLFLSGWSERSLQPHLFGLPVRLADAQLFLAGLGLGLEIAPVSAAVLDAVGEAQRGAGAAVLIVMRLLGMLVGFSLLAGYGLYQFHRATAHLLPPIPTLLPDFPVRYATYVLHLRQALLSEYHLIFQSTAVALAIGALIAALTLRPLPRARWR